MTQSAASLSAEIVRLLTATHRTIAVAESLTGGLLTAELVRTPGASAVLRGGIVAYHTDLKHSLLGVDVALLAEHGPVHPEVAAQMATGVRARLAVDGTPADIGISTTGVAGPGPEGGHPAGTVFLGFAIGGTAQSTRLSLTGDRDEVRAAVVLESLRALAHLLA
ncbi:MAG: CinA family protein [Salinibacterium sp.]|nr:MAG: CinA family protein [Salinibacterium sp.]